MSTGTVVYDPVEDEQEDHSRVTEDYFWHEEDWQMFEYKRRKGLLRNNIRIPGLNYSPAGKFSSSATGRDRENARLARLRKQLLHLAQEEETLRIVRAQPRTIARDIRLAKIKWGTDGLIEQLYIAKHAKVARHGDEAFETFRETNLALLNAPKDFLTLYTARVWTKHPGHFMYLWTEVFDVVFPDDLPNIVGKLDFVRTTYYAADELKRIDREYKEWIAERIDLRLKNREEDIYNGRKPGYAYGETERDRYPELRAFVVESDTESYTEEDFDFYASTYPKNIKKAIIDGMKKESGSEVPVSKGGKKPSRRR
jgi:hypothetical protein